MSEVPVCVRPVAFKRKVQDQGFNMMVDYSMGDLIDQVKPYMIDFEPNSRCAGACAYCYASSDSATDIVIPKEVIFKAIEEASQLGIRFIEWCGGDALMHPDWPELLKFLADKGMEASLLTSGLISKRAAQQIVAIGPSVTRVGVNLGSVNQQAYDKVHTDPKTMHLKMQGWRNLLEAGYPANQVMGIITTTQPALETIEETMDWMVDEMGCRAVCLVHFKSCGFAGYHKSWEPTLTSTHKAIEYRAKKLGEQWKSIGASDGSFLYCRVNIAILYDGSVTPCTMLREPDFIEGNIYNESLVSIFERGRDRLLFNYEIKGVCGNGECQYGDVCFGCRATAYHYLGDITASDPKCPYNPEAKETYWR